MNTTHNYKLSWSKDGSLGKHQETEPLALVPLDLIVEKCKTNKAVTVLQRGNPPNDDKFFLDRIVK